MVAATAKPKTSKKSAKPRTAKAPAHSWDTGQFVFKGNGSVLMNETITPQSMARIWAKLPGVMSKNGPGKYTIAIETTSGSSSSSPSPTGRAR